MPSRELITVDRRFKIVDRIAFAEPSSYLGFPIVGKFCFGVIERRLPVFENFASLLFGIGRLFGLFRSVVEPLLDNIFFLFLT